MRATTTLGAEPFEGSGLWAMPVEHEGNRNSSVEEVEAVGGIVSLFLRSGARWIDRTGNMRSMTPSDVLVVAPREPAHGAARPAVRSRWHCR